MTLAEYRGTEREPEPPAHEAGAHVHPGVREYVQIGLILALITSIEVAVYYFGLGQWNLTGVLVILSAIKFGLVVLWFMHLRFDSRLLSIFFVGGIALATTLFVVVLATLGGGLF